MSVNCNEIDLLLEELDLTGDFVQEIVQPSFDSIVLYTYKLGRPKTVFISLSAGECRINEVRRKITKNDKPLRFNEILRSKIKGARITSCGQLGKERIVKIALLKTGPLYVMPAAKEKFEGKKTEIRENSEDETLYLYIRLWSNAGNIFLCDENNVILDSFYRRPKKGEVSGEKLNMPDSAALHITEEKRAKLNEKYPVRDFSELENSGNLSFNEKVDAFYSSASARNSLENLLAQAEKWYNAHKSKQDAALENLEEKRKTFLNASQWKHQGDLILAYAYLFSQPRENPCFLECEDYESGKTVRLAVNPKKSVQENAAVYYETYKKMTGGLSELEKDIESAKKAAAELEEKYRHLVQEKNPVKLEQILRREQKPKQQTKDARPGLLYTVGGWNILVGRDAAENDELLRRYVKGDDMWFHTRDFPGGYVFVKAQKGKTVPLEIIIAAGNLAVHYSKARKNGKADLYYTKVKYLRRAKNGPKGLVLPSNEKNLFIKLDSEILRNLENKTDVV